MIKVKWIIFCTLFTIGHISVYNCYYLHHYAEHNEKNVWNVNVLEYSHLKINQKQKLILSIRSDI